MAGYAARFILDRTMDHGTHRGWYERIASATLTLLAAAT